MVGWRDFDASRPNSGHIALAELERMGKIGVLFEDRSDYYAPQNQETWAFGNGQNQMSILTQNVDMLHKKAGAVHITELHGRTSRLVCMQCGAYRSRDDFHTELESLNQQWLSQVLKEAPNDNAMRPDGDAHVARESYDDIIIPPCEKCGGFLKPDVVFFGDTVPKHRVERCRAAVDASDGLLCIGTSLAVHSAYRFVRAASSKGIPICILNVGETRAEQERLHLLKIEAPVGVTLTECVHHFESTTGTGGVVAQS